MKERRTIERSLVEGIAERDAEGLRGALSQVDTLPPGEVAEEIVSLARRVVACAEIEEALVEGVQTRNADGKLESWIAKAAEHSGSGRGDEVDDAKVSAAKVELVKLVKFEECRTAIKDEKPEALKVMIDHINVSDIRVVKPGGDFSQTCAASPATHRMRACEPSRACS